MPRTSSPDKELFACGPIRSNPRSTRDLKLVYFHSSFRVVGIPQRAASSIHRRRRSLACLAMDGIAASSADHAAESESMDENFVDDEDRVIMLLQP
jgi:hypothetical protein